MGKTIKIGLIADTHIPTRLRELPARIFEIFQGTDYIIHAGDYVRVSVIDELQSIAPVIGCVGNMDPSDIRTKLPPIATLEVEKKIILVIHDLWGNPKRLEGINKKQVDVIVHGHSHKATIQKEENVLIINPGSPIASIYSGRTVGLLYLTPNNIEVEIVELR